MGGKFVNDQRACEEARGGAAFAATPCVGLRLYYGLDSGCVYGVAVLISS